MRPDSKTLAPFVAGMLFTLLHVPLRGSDLEDRISRSAVSHEIAGRAFLSGEYSIAEDFYADAVSTIPVSVLASPGEAEKSHIAHVSNDFAWFLATCPDFNHRNGKGRYSSCDAGRETSAKRNVSRFLVRNDQWHSPQSWPR